jgi:hypothetical protein
MSQQRDPNTPAVLLVGVVGCVLLLATVVGLIAVYQNVEQSHLQDKVYNVVPQELAQLRAKQQAQINSYRHMPGDEGRIGLPIERAMELMADELNALEEPEHRATPTELMSDLLVELGFHLPDYPASASIRAFPVELKAYPEEVQAEILAALAAREEPE